MRSRILKVERCVISVLLMILAVALPINVAAEGPQTEDETADLMQVAAEGSQQVTAQGDTGAGSSGVEVSLVTCYPGSRNYELYGHTMIRVKVADDDLLFNYGIFNFRAKGFIYRFVKGECDYMLAAYPFSYLTQGYESRKIVEQKLNLTDEQKQKVLAYLWWNALPENATYRYDWAYNNCATKPRDIVEEAVGGSLRYGNPQEPNSTFRTIMEYYDRNYPWQQFGIDLVLGYGLDHVLTYREQMFSPIKLMQAFAGATIERDGKRVSLVSETVNLVDGGDEGAVLAPTPWLFTPICVFLVILIIVIMLTIREYKEKNRYKWLDSVVFGSYTLAGILVAFLTFVSTHYGTSPNVNILWVNPLAVIPAVGVWLKCCSKVLKVYHAANAAILLLLALCWWALPQVGNLAFLPLGAVSFIRSASYLLAGAKGTAKILGKK